MGDSIFRNGNSKVKVVVAMSGGVDSSVVAAMLVEQGYEIGRPSRLYLRAHDDGSRIHVQVGGKVLVVAKGNLL